MANALLMGITTEGSTRIGQKLANGLVFSITDVAYGTSGYDPLLPTSSLALNPAATALTAEVFRKTVPAKNTLKDTIEAPPGGKETTYTTVSGLEFTGILGEAGIFATVSDPGTTGLAVGYKFLLAQAHFPRVTFSVYSRLAIDWPIDYSP